jgi:single-stranded DNA-binding protein
MLSTSETRWNKELEQRQKNTVCHNIVTYGPSAEGLHRILRKGHLVAVIGSIRNSKGMFEVLARRIQVFENYKESGDFNESC